jgi:hypothetical protein
MKKLRKRRLVLSQDQSLFLKTLFPNGNTIISL